MTICTIEWNKLGLNEWEALFGSIRRSNLLQSYPYAQAACLFNHHKARWGLVRINGAAAGLVQIFETGLLGHTLHVIILDRGPLWLPDFGAPEHILAFFASFDREFPRRFGRYRRIMPEIDQSQALLVPFKSVSNVKPYRTIWIDLTKDEEELRTDLDKPWRNALSKAERENIRIEWSAGGEALDWILLHHEAHRTMKNFRAASLKFIRLLARFSEPRKDMLIGRAFIRDKPVAAILFFRHGAAATYQIGWSGDVGRKVNAHQLLLWQGMMKLKEWSVMDVDLGGINDQAEGVRTFKEGMGGKVVTMAGMYT